MKREVERPRFTVPETKPHGERAAFHGTERERRDAAIMQTVGIGIVDAE